MFLQRKMLACAIAVLGFLVSGCSDPSGEATAVPVVGQSEVLKQSCVSNELHEAEAHDEIDMAILSVTSRLSQTDFDAKTLCERIARVEDEEMQRRYFKRLLDVAYSVRFEDYGDVHATDFGERQRVINRLGFAYHGLESLSLAVWSHYWTRKASQREQFYPLFMYVEKMKTESERRHVQESLCLGGLSVIERIYNVNMKAGNDDPDGFAWVRQNFERIAGRPIRSERQFNDGRRNR